MRERIIRQFNDTIDATIRSIEPLLPGIELAANHFVTTLLTDHKILGCGNGSSANTIRQFTTYLIDHFHHERPGLPAMALAADSATLSAIASDYHFNEIFSRQIRALGQPGDTLLIATHKSTSSNLVHALRAAHERDMAVVLLAGEETTDLSPLMTGRDIALHIPSASRARIQEVQLMVVHCLCDLIETQLFGDPEQGR
ncbi:MAG: SIS domain-containing protein [Gammaproteobacteria bacterium]|nr:MAG: SIS domain-containing protein [Gammaproteobacteria bacterium]